MLIFSDIWLKTIFQNDLKNVVFLEMLIFLVIFLAKKQFFEKDLKYVFYAEMLILPKMWTKIDFFQKDLEKRCFSRKVDIFGDIFGQKTDISGYMDKNRFFQKDLVVVSADMLIFSDIWLKTIFQNDLKNIVFLEMLISLVIFFGQKNGFSI